MTYQNYTDVYTHKHTEGWVLSPHSLLVQRTQPFVLACFSFSPVTTDVTTHCDIYLNVCSQGNNMSTNTHRFKLLILILHVVSSFSASRSFWCCIFFLLKGTRTALCWLLNRLHRINETNCTIQILHLQNIQYMNSCVKMDSLPTK